MDSDLDEDDDEWKVVMKASGMRNMEAFDLDLVCKCRLEEIRCGGVLLEDDGLREVENKVKTC